MKVGDEVLCINNSYAENINLNFAKVLLFEKNNFYSILLFDKNDNSVAIKAEKYGEWWYFLEDKSKRLFSDYFLTKQQLRAFKLKKIDESRR